MAEKIEDAEIGRLRTLLSSSGGEQGWRTMDSAPKDGTPILIEAMLSQGLVVVEVRYDAGAQIRGRYGAFVWAPTDGGDIIAEGAARRWMPLPSAPTRVVQEPSDDGDVVVTGAEIEAQSSPQPTAGGGAENMHAIEIAERGYADWAAKPHNAKWVQRIEGTPIPNDLKVCIAMAFKDALSAERARVIEQAEQIATDAAINEEIILRDFMGRPDLAGAWQGACNFIAAAIRALGQQDTGGADHG